MIAFIQKWGRVGIILSLILALVGVLFFLNAILFPFILAAFLAYVLAPVIHHMNQWKIRGRKIPRGAAILIVYLILLELSIGGGSYLIPNVTNELTGMLNELPDEINVVSKKWIPEIETQIEKWVAFFPKLQDDANAEPPLENTQRPSSKKPLDPLARELHPWNLLLANYTFEIRTIEPGRMEVIPKKRVSSNGNTPKEVDLQLQLSELVQDGIKRFKSDLIEFLNLGRKVITRIAGSIFSIFLTFMVSAFILVDVDRILEFNRSLLPKRYHRAYDQFLVKLDSGLSGVVRGQLIICMVNGALTGIGLVWIGVPFAFTLAILATICSLIPIFGTFLSSVPIIIMGLTVSFTTALLSIGWVLMIHFIEANFLNPKIMGTAAKIHPVLIIFVLVAGEYVAGLAGALLAVPIFSIIQTMFLFFKSFIEDLEQQTYASQKTA
ncbi:AI-2E family transporter [Deltaproteobacteria bacterium TL4]